MATPVPKHRRTSGGEWSHANNWWNDRCVWGGTGNDAGNSPENRQRRRTSTTWLKELLNMYGVIEFGEHRPVSESLKLYVSKDWPKPRLVSLIVPIWERMVDHHLFVLGKHSLL